ncbi:MAG: DUF1990 domain-containing protein [Acidimicrobiales bacterium]|jgi:uncharacterized protein (UPF0548 family)
MLRRPDDGRLQAVLDAVRDRPVSYAEVGATRDGRLVSGYRHVAREVVTGAGDDAFDRSVERLRSWAPLRAAGLRLWPPDASIREGVDVAATKRLGLLHVVVLCRIVYVVEDPDRYGFAYGTLPGHPEEGEELFCVTKQANGDVVFRIVAFSRPADVLTRLGGPLGRRVQRRMTDRYLSSL